MPKAARDDRFRAAIGLVSAVTVAWLVVMGLATATLEAAKPRALRDPACASIRHAGPALALELAESAREVECVLGPNGPGKAALERNTRLDYVFIALSLALFVLLGAFVWVSATSVAARGLAFLAVLGAVLTAGLDVYENGRLFDVLGLWPGPIPDSAMQALRLATQLKWASFFGTLLLLAPPLLWRGIDAFDPGLPSVGGLFVLAACFGVAGISQTIVGPAALVFARADFLSAAMLVVGVALLLSAILLTWAGLRSGAASAAASGSGTFKDLFAQELEGLFGIHLATLRSRAGQEQVSEPSASTPGVKEPYVTYAPQALVGLALSGGGIRSATFNLGLLQGLERMRLLECVHYLSTVSGGGYIGGWWTAWRARQNSLFPTPVALGDEAPAVRHVRQFSRFLAPRVGLFEIETGNLIVAFLSAVIPSLVVSLAVCVLAVALWFGLAHTVLDPRKAAGLVLFPLLTFLGQSAVEAEWRRRQKAAPVDQGVVAFRIALLLVCLAGAGVWVLASASGPWAGAACDVNAKAPVDSWRALGLAALEAVFSLHHQLPAALWLGLALAVIVVRVAIAPLMPSPDARRAALDRIVARLLLYALVWGCAAALWNLAERMRGESYGPLLTSGAAAGLFAAVVQWFTTLPKKVKVPGVWERLRPLLPQLLAYVAVGGSVLAVMISLVSSLTADDWLVPKLALGIVALALVLFDPVEVGLHSFYRGRLSRAYLGASNGSPPAARTEEADSDDLLLSALPERRPLHLVCCTANDVAGDPLFNLGRAGQSAVLSRHGMSVGNRHGAGQQSIRLSSALTASGAALNSNMGALSVELGPAVTLLLTALNLRLGLWVSLERSSRWSRFWRGLPFFQEMFGLTRADGASVHLSDGGHFENLGLYELVRRHCQYVIVSDCGEDPDVAFDDVGNALRRVREDFGVQVDLDLDALRPTGTNKYARQHAVVGSIRYPEGDVGVLVYFKPSLTGSEPDDVLQYKTRNHAFPHESTGDQFYDAQQWESYRRLGEHAATSVFAFLSRSPAISEAAREPTHRVSAIFTGVRNEWYPTPQTLRENFLGLTERYNALDGALHAGGLPALVHEIYPELAGDAPGAERPPLMTTADMSKALPLLLQAIQLMEDVWFGAQLDSHWDHPLNLGWVNYFHRWAHAPTFRMWWPVLKAGFGPRFNRFAVEHFGLPSFEPPVGQLTASRGAFRPGLAAGSWLADGGRSPGRQEFVFEYALDLRNPAGVGSRLQVALLLAEIDVRRKTIFWGSGELFVMPGLWGSGLGADFLACLMGRLPGYSALVALEPRARRASYMSTPVHEFYAAAGFVPTKTRDHLVRW